MDSRLPYHWFSLMVLAFRPNLLNFNEVHLQYFARPLALRMLSAISLINSILAGNKLGFDFSK